MRYTYFVTHVIEDTAAKGNFLSFGSNNKELLISKELEQGYKIVYLEEFTYTPYVLPQNLEFKGYYCQI